MLLCITMSNASHHFYKSNAGWTGFVDILGQVTPFGATKK